MKPISRNRAFTLAELLVVLTIVGTFLVAFASLPRRRCGGVSRRLVCASNLKGIGTAMKIYANENDGRWASPAFDTSLMGLIDYTIAAGSGEGSARSPDRWQASLDRPGGARQLSTTRAFWILVRSGDITVRQVICPQSSDVEDPTPNLAQAYDFAGPKNISYGFQVPYGPPQTRASEAADPRMILAADKGPLIDASIVPPGLPMNPRPGWGPDPADPEQWAGFHSPNHPNGQNMLFADGHASFGRTPLGGVDRDNIYTVAADNEFEASRWHGESPWVQAAPPFSSTDSVIFP